MKKLSDRDILSSDHPLLVQTTIHPGIPKTLPGSRLKNKSSLDSIVEEGAKQTKFPKLYNVYNGTKIPTNLDF